MRLILGQCAFDFEAKVQHHVTQSLELTETQSDRIHMISLKSLTDRNIILAKGSLLTQDQFDRACDEWSNLTIQISWNEELSKAVSTLKSERRDSAHPPGVSREEATTALDYVYVPTWSFPTH